MSAVTLQTGETQEGRRAVATATRPIRLVIVDDHPLVREGLRTVLSAEPDLEVVGEAGRLRDGLRAVAVHEPDVVILDVALPDGSGIDGCRRIRRDLPAVKVLILTGIADEAVLAAGRAAGANGFILKTAQRGRIAGAVRKLAGGGEAFEGPADSHHVDSPAWLDRLTAREQDILRRVARGWTNREIACDLDLTEKTVKNYVSTVLTKVGVPRRAGAASVYARYEERSHHSIPACTWPDAGTCDLPEASAWS